MTATRILDGLERSEATGAEADSVARLGFLEWAFGLEGEVTPAKAKAALDSAETLAIGPADHATGQPLPRAHRGTLPAGTVDTLTAFAHRTYAPGTPESRASGAGAGLTDND